MELLKETSTFSQKYNSTEKTMQNAMMCLSLSEWSGIADKKLTYEMAMIWKKLYDEYLKLEKLKLSRNIVIVFSFSLHQKLLQIIL